MKSYVNRYFDHVSDTATEWVGSTVSIIVHTILFVVVFGLHWLGVSMQEILLLLTTALSLEAIYLAIFIQRSVNKQSIRLESAIDKIVNNVSQNLEQPLDEVVGEIRNTVLKTHRALAKTIAEESDQVVTEVGELLEEDDEEPASTYRPSTLPRSN